MRVRANSAANFSRLGGRFVATSFPLSWISARLRKDAASTSNFTFDVLIETQLKMKVTNEKNRAATSTESDTSSAAKVEEKMSLVYASSNERGYAGGDNS